MTREERRIMKAMDEHIIKLGQLAEETDDRNEQEYLLGRQQTYIKAKQQFKETTNSLDINKLWPSILSIVEIGGIMVYEQRNILSTKAMQFVTKGRIG